MPQVGILGRRPTKADVARRANVSTATVSYVLNNGPRPVAATTKQRVLRAIRELDYEPSELARSMRLNRTRTIGLILPDTANPFFSAVAKGVEHTVSAMGYGLLLCHSDYDRTKEEAYAGVMIAKQVDGIVYIRGTDDVAPLERLLRRGIPVVVADRAVPSLPVDSVVGDNFGGGYAATKHLLTLGHRRIGCIVRSSALANATERVRGYRAALKDARVPFDRNYVVSGGIRCEDGASAMRNILSLRPRPTAVVAYSDFVAIGALRAAFEAGVAVPRDVSVVGFDDIPIAAFQCPSLTTIAMPKQEMGAKAAAVLMAKIQESRKIRRLENIVLPVKLIERESTSPPVATRDARSSTRG